MTTLRKLVKDIQARDFDLAEQVGPVFDAMKADPSRAIPAKKAFAAVRTHHAAKMKAKKNSRPTPPR